ncbi:hypothetical protein D3C85_1092830 [compost metagenome]
MHIDWQRPIQLPKVPRKSSLIFDTSDVPNVPGVYVFFVRIGTNTTRVVYAGSSAKLQKRLTGHQNNHKLMMALLSHKGSCFMVPGVFKALRGQVAGRCIKTIERVLIRSFLEDGHPLINVAGTRISTEYVVSTLPPGTRFVQESIGFEKRKPK